MSNVEQYKIAVEPFYAPQGNEVDGQVFCGQIPQLRHHRLAIDVPVFPAGNVVLHVAV